MTSRTSDPRTGQGARAEVDAGQADRGQRTSRVASNRGPVHDALTYTAWGWPVLPCRPGAKLPATEREKRGGRG
jgi:hypothetical protein